MPISKHSPCGEYAPVSHQSQNRIMISSASMPFRSATLNARQSAMLVSSDHVPGFWLCAPPPIISVIGFWRSASRRMNSAGTPTAYRVGLGDDTVAVVDVVNAGRVHLADGLDAGQRVYVAAVAASLLLLDPELGE